MTLQALQRLHIDDALIIPPAWQQWPLPSIPNPHCSGDMIAPGEPSKRRSAKRPRTPKAPSKPRALAMARLGLCFRKPRFAQGRYPAHVDLRQHRRLCLPHLPDSCARHCAILHTLFQVRPINAAELNSHSSVGRYGQIFSCPYRNIRCHASRNVCLCSLCATGHASGSNHGRDERDSNVYHA